MGVLDEIGRHVQLRPARMSDCLRLWWWRNLPDVRRNMLCSHVVGPLRHLGWLRARLRLERMRQLEHTWVWVIQFASHDGSSLGIPVGSLHLNGSEVYPEISVIVARSWRGFGVAPAAVARLQEMAGSGRLGQRVRGLRAVVKDGNAASMAVFRKAGFSCLTPGTWSLHSWEWHIGR